MSQPHLNLYDLTREAQRQLLVRWGFDWADVVREAMRNGQASNSYDAEIVGQAILGAIHQVASEGARSQRKREEVLDNLTRFLVQALKP